MSKGPWEKRVGALLDTFCPYKYKPVDSPLHGGAVRLDWLATDSTGIFWAIEVKQLSGSRISFNLENPGEMRPLQMEALNSIAEASRSVPVIAIGLHNRLYVWGWRHVWAQYQWRKREAPYQKPTFKPHFLPLKTCLGTARYQTDKLWLEYGPKLTRALVNNQGVPGDQRIADVLNRLDPLSSGTDRLAWITKQGDMSIDFSAKSKSLKRTNTRKPRATYG